MINFIVKLLDIRFTKREQKEKGDTMSYDYSSLLGKITEKFGTQYNFSIAMGLSERSISLKLNDKVSWKDDEIIKAISVLEIDPNDIPKYFFDAKVHVK